ncbi:MAG: hypothetical protein Sylvanvirus1_75 [Sylvanvirus sp.]|uniref:Uncharacterized protein n=1 Tax=Sylvanvirus sp. TaxID=2487774 RepID=A0A3G5AKM7_9VIRU|nr:MAG: hypothetical protein Sylvanvirus1_75 [Sylvanvirus sp.]
MSRQQLIRYLTQCPHPSTKISTIDQWFLNRGQRLLLWTQFNEPTRYATNATNTNTTNYMSPFTSMITPFSSIYEMLSRLTVEYDQSQQQKAQLQDEKSTGSVEWSVLDTTPPSKNSILYTKVIPGVSIENYACICASPQEKKWLQQFFQSYQITGSIPFPPLQEEFPSNTFKQTMQSIGGCILRAPISLEEYLYFFDTFLLLGYQLEQEDIYSPIRIVTWMEGFRDWDSFIQSFVLRITSDVEILQNKVHDPRTMIRLLYPDANEQLVCFVRWRWQRVLAVRAIKESK